MQADAIRLLAKASVAWSGIGIGEDETEFSTENAIRLYTLYPFIREQVVRSCSGVERFYPRLGSELIGYCGSGVSRGSAAASGFPTPLLPLWAAFLELDGYRPQGMVGVCLIPLRERLHIGVASLAILNGLGLLRVQLVGRPRGKAVGSAYPPRQGALPALAEGNGGVIPSATRWLSKRFRGMGAESCNAGRLRKLAIAYCSDRRRAVTFVRSSYINLRC